MLPRPMLHSPSHRRDILHPTTMGHKLISDFVTRNLKSAGLL